MDMMCSFGLPLFDLEDNSTMNVISRLKKFRKLYEPYHGYLCTVICSFGILTNLINVVVLTKRQMRTSINVLLTGIAFCDMATMASYLIYIIHFVLADHRCNPYLYTYGWMFFLMCHVVLSIAFHTTTLWLSVAMAFIRNMTLRQARVGSPWLRSDNTWKICAVVYAFVFFLSVPNVFSNGILPWHDYFNQTCDQSTVEEMESRYKTYTIGVPPENCLVFTVTFWLTGTLFKIIPCVLLTLLIFSLLCTIKRAEKNRQALLDMNRNRAILNLTATAALGPHPRPHRENSQTRSDRTTAMLLMILGLSLLTELPQGAVNILSGIYVEHMQTFVYPNVADILDLLSLINSSVNFILYCIMSSKYRQVFWQVVLPRKVYVHWFVRARQSARVRSQNARRPHGGRPLTATARFCPEAQNLCAVSNFLNRPNRRHRGSDFETAYDNGGDDFTTNDLGTERVITGISPKYDQNTPIGNSRDGRDPIFTFTIDNRDGIEDTPEPWFASSPRLRNLLLPKNSPKRRSSAPPTASFASTSRISAKDFSNKTTSKITLLPLRSSVITGDQSADHFTMTKTGKRKTFPLHLFARGSKSKKPDMNGNKSNTERKQWLLGCACLCKCAFKSGLESSSANLVGCRPSEETVAIDETSAGQIEMLPIILRTEEDLDEDAEDASRISYSPTHSDLGQEETTGP